MVPKRRPSHTPPNSNNITSKGVAAAEHVQHLLAPHSFVSRAVVRTLQELRQRSMWTFITRGATRMWFNCVTSSQASPFQRLFRCDPPQTPRHAELRKERGLNQAPFWGLAPAHAEESPSQLLANSEVSRRREGAHICNKMNTFQL